MRGVIPRPKVARCKNSYAIRYIEKKISLKIKEKIKNINGKPLAKPPIINDNRESPDTGNPFAVLSESEISSVSDADSEVNFDDIRSDVSDVPYDGFDDEDVSSISSGVSEAEKPSIAPRQTLIESKPYIERPSGYTDITKTAKYITEVPPWHISRKDKLSVRRNKSFANGKLSLPHVLDGYIVVAHRDSIRFHTMRADFYLWARQQLSIIHMKPHVRFKELLLLINRLNYQYLGKSRETRSFRFIKASLHFCLRQISKCCSDPQWSSSKEPA